MKTTLLLLAIMLCMGCNVSRVQKKTVDQFGSTTTVNGWNCRFMWTSEGLALYASTNEIRYNAETTSSDSQFARALSEGATTAALKYRDSQMPLPAAGPSAFVPYAAPAPPVVVTNYIFVPTPEAYATNLNATVPPVK